MSRLRILTGRLKGTPLEMAPGVRPTESRVREALMAIWGDRLADCAFLDLFAGTGAVGLEALSQGARSVVLIDHAPRVLAVLRRNVGRRTGVEVRRRRLPAELAFDERYDLAFADPPYAFADYPGLVRCAVEVLTDGGELVVEHSIRVEMPADVSGWRAGEPRRYGETGLTFYRRSRALPDEAAEAGRRSAQQEP